MSFENSYKSKREYVYTAPCRSECLVSSRCKSGIKFGSPHFAHWLLLVPPFLPCYFLNYTTSACIAISASLVNIKEYAGGMQSLFGRINRHKARLFYRFQGPICAQHVQRSQRCHVVHWRRLRWMPKWKIVGCSLWLSSSSKCMLHLWRFAKHHSTTTGAGQYRSLFSENGIAFTCAL